MQNGLFHVMVGLLYYIRGQGVPITLLVFEQVLGEHRCGTVLLCHVERGFFEFKVLGKATFRWRGFSEDGRCVLGDLDEFGRDHGIKPDNVGEHLFGFRVLHGGIVRQEIFINQRFRVKGYS